jgi:hypothetical protein
MNSHVSQQTCQFRLGRNHLFVGRENCTTLITQFQLFVVARGDRFLGNTKRRRAYDRVNGDVTAGECPRRDPCH